MQYSVRFERRRLKQLSTSRSKQRALYSTFLATCLAERKKKGHSAGHGTAPKRGVYKIHFKVPCNYLLLLLSIPYILSQVL